MQQYIANPFTDERQTSKTVSGAVIGGAAGAAAGASTGRDSESRRERALISSGGFVVLTPPAVGTYMDRQEAQLRQQLKNNSVGVIRDGDRIILNMPVNITFDTNSAGIKSNFYEVLHSVALVLDKYKSTLININGYTDSSNNDQYNLKLSQRRAQSVGQYLISQGRIDSTRMAAHGMGEFHPIASKDTPQGRCKTGCVQMEIAPLVVLFQP
jgi:outer membrane protein OmpA-like peptidoglycan-associated protein